MKFSVLALLFGISYASEACENQDVKIARATLEGVDAHLKT